MKGYNFMNHPETIGLEYNPETGACELTGINGEVDISDRIVDAVASDQKLAEYVTLHIAHNRAEQSTEYRSQSIGQLVAREIVTVQAEIQQRLQSGV